jgi:hypothetical protein
MWFAVILLLSTDGVGVYYDARDKPYKTVETCERALPALEKQARDNDAFMQSLPGTIDIDLFLQPMCSRTTPAEWSRRLHRIESKPKEEQHAEQ